VPRLPRCAPGERLPHEPRPVLQMGTEARILIAGQAPGVRVHASGQPFTDPSGERLRRWLGIDSEVFYNPRRVAILPMGFCFPGLSSKGSDLPPRPECAPLWRARLMAYLPRLQLIIALGRYAQAWHLGPDCGASLDATVGNWRAALERRPSVLPMSHPSWRNNAWLKRNPWFEAEVVPEAKRRVAALL